MQLTERKSYSFWIAVTAILLGGTSLAYPRTLLDSPLSTYIAGVILEGGVPYRDAWDPRAPGVFFAYALQILLLGKSAVALRAFDVLWQLATALTLAAMERRIYQQRPASLIAGISYLGAYFSQNFWHWAEPDTFVSLPLALAFLFLLRGLDRQKDFDWFIAAMFVGIATLFKLPYGLFGALLICAVIRRARENLRHCAGNFVALAAGFATPLVACVLYFYAKGALQDFLTSQFVFAPAYVAQVHKVAGFRDFLESALRPVLVPFYVMAAFGVGWFIVRLRGPDKPRFAETLLVGWFAIWVIAFFLHGSFLGYHYMTALAPISVLAAHPLLLVFQGFRNRPLFPRRVLAALVVLSAVVPLENFRQHVVYSWRAIHGQIPAGPWRDLGKYIRERTSPEENIFVWGNVPLVYLSADRKAASRFLCTAYLSLKAPNLDYRALLLAELAEDRPTYFVLAKQGPITPGLPDSVTSLQEFEGLQKWISTEYKLEIETEAYSLFKFAPPHDQP